MKILKAFAADASGATAIEYALIAAIISTVIVGALGTISQALNGTFSSVSESFN